MKFKNPNLPVAALFVSGRSIYKHMPNVIAYDKTRDACQFTGHNPIIAHPPCRTWSKYLRQFAKPLDLKAEQQLAFFALEKVMSNGGVLEQPAGSHFWSAAKLPALGNFSDPFCYTIQIEQRWFGYGSRKKTWLLICGVPKAWLPSIPFTFDASSDCARPDSQCSRSRTMLPFANWLYQVARSSWWQLKS